MTYRERRLAKAERLRGWAEKREREATAALNTNPELRRDWAFITQPGHIPERARMNARDDRAFASMEKAAGMSSRAAEIERQADRAIYDDDPDAIERLEEKAAGLDARADCEVAENKAARKANPALRPWEVPHFSSLTRANARRCRERIKTIRAKRAQLAEVEAAGGMKIHRFEGGTSVGVQFAEKPERDVLEALRAAGFYFQGGAWYGPADKIPVAVLEIEAGRSA